MYILGGGRLKEIGILGVAVVLAFGYVVYSAPYRMERVVTLLNPTQDTQGSAYQLNQALISIGSGGISGVGIGHSRQKYNFLPETMTDSIFAIFAEETGFVGSLFLVFLLLFFLFRGFVIARASRENFSRFLAGGIAIWIVSQSLLNIAANLGLMPLTGIPLPFFSYGGSGMNAVLAACGILLNISRYTA
jgi:cell division protein FtsW